MRSPSAHLNEKCRHRHPKTTPKQYPLYQRQGIIGGLPGGEGAGGMAISDGLWGIFKEFGFMAINTGDGEHIHLMPCGAQIPADKMVCTDRSGMIMAIHTQLLSVRDMRIGLLNCLMARKAQ